jgi:outer membrane lipoprotein-sorting protein
MIVRAAAAILLLSSIGVSQESADEAAQAALRKLSAKLKDARTLSARVVQHRKTELTEKPITSSGMMYYRRDPARLVFHLTEPRKAEIHMDRGSYQVYRPDEKRLERTDFENEEVTAKILMVFEPKPDDLGKTFTIKAGAAKDGRLEVTLESSDPKVRKRLRKIVLTVAEADGALHNLAYTDGEGDEVRFELSDVAINPDLSADLFTLKVPEGTRVIRRTMGKE